MRHIIKPPFEKEVLTLVDKPGTRFSVQNEDELWPGADPSHVSKRADGTIKDRPGERMFSAHQKQRNNDHTEG
jgi:hypothetical protein